MGKQRSPRFSRILSSSLILFLSLTLVGSAVGQSYNMTNGSVNTCSGTFFDSGGGAGDYSNNESFTYTICPSNSSLIEVDFSFFDVEASFDQLCVYDGDNTGAPQIGCFDNSNGLSGTVLQASSSTPTGCLTFEFTSDGSVTNGGWEASVNCTYTCQTVEAVLNSTTPSGTGPNGEVEVCKGDVVAFDGDANYPNNDSLYHQSDSTSTFIWDFGDGTLDTGQNVSHAYSTPGIYDPKLNVIDSNGCTSDNQILQTVVVAPEPDFNGTQPLNDTICLGDSNAIAGVVNQDTLYGTCSPPSDDTTALPDGSGVSYTSTVTTGCYAPGQTLNDVNDLLNICVSMEHSYLGDLQLTITCPSGQTVTLADPFNGSGGNEFLGEPIDGNTGTPGDGYQYCFNNNPTYGTWSNEAGNHQYSYTDNLGNTYTNKDYLPAGSYASNDPLSNLVGCQLNGDWTVEVTDNLSIDDGHIFNWYIEFSDSILPPSKQQTVGIDTSGWNSDPSILATNGDTALVQPSSPGTKCYTFSALDSFGCPYDTSICFEVVDVQANVAPPDSIGCGNGSVTLDASSSTTASGSIVYSWSNGDSTATTTVTSTGNYSVTITDPVTGCSDDSTVTVAQSSNYFDITIDSVVDVSCNGACDGEIHVSNIAGSAPYTYQWDDPSGQTSQDATGLCGGTFVIEAQDSSGCTVYDTATVVEPPPFQLSTSADTTICIGGTATLSATATNGTPGYTYHWDNGLGTGQVQTVSPGSDTTYEVYAEDSNGCLSDTQNVQVNLHPSLQVSTSPDDSICPGDSALISANGSGGIGSGFSYSWSNGDNGTPISVSPGSDQSYVVTLEDGCETPSAQDTVDITIDPLPNVQFDGMDLNACSPVEATFVNTTVDSMVGNDCIWSFGDGSQVVGCDTVTNTLSSPGCHDVTLQVKSPDGCVDSATRTDMVCVYPYPDADFTFEPQDATVQDPAIDFTNLSTGADSYSWSFMGADSSNEISPSYVFPNEDAGTYEVCLEATSTYGCQDTICKDVTIQGKFLLYVPNAFNPDGDGVNEVFRPVVQGADPSDYRFMVYDRWGEVVFETKDIQEGWDGSIKGQGNPSKTDVYVWRLITKNRYNGKTIEKKGHVTVVR